MSDYWGIDKARFSKEQVKLFEDLAKEQVAAQLEEKFDREMLAAVGQIKSTAHALEEHAKLEARNARAIQDKRIAAGHDGEDPEPPRRSLRQGDRAIYAQCREKKDAILDGLTQDELQDDTIWWPLIAPFVAECRSKLGDVVYEMLLAEDVARQKLENKRKREEARTTNMLTRAYRAIPRVAKRYAFMQSSPEGRAEWRDLVQRTGSELEALRRLGETIKITSDEWEAGLDQVVAEDMPRPIPEPPPPPLEERIQAAVASMLPMMQAQIEASAQRSFEAAKSESRARGRQMMKQYSPGPRFLRGPGPEDRMAVGN